MSWHKAGLTYGALMGWAMDATGNVALDHGNPFSQVEQLGYTVYLPVVVRP